MFYYDLPQSMDFFWAACQAWVGEILATLKAEGEEIHVPQDLIRTRILAGPKG
jgi:hypothetical protein